MAKRTISKQKIVYPEYNLGERIKFIRESRKLTQTELAKKCDSDQSTIANIEKGNKDPSLQTLIKIANGLDTHIANLFGTEDVLIFDIHRLRRKYNTADKLTPHLYMALGRVVQYAKDIGFLT